MYKFLAGILTIFLTTTALALNSEYKNSLTKIDLNKSGDSSYNINLYTQNEFSEPVKVIKKSDLNYYILLPETKNNNLKTTSNNSDIRSIDTQLFPYAGADVKNGYTKININTTKPINFTVSTKTVSAQKPQQPTVKEAKKEIKEETKTIVDNTKVQKKNLVQENSKSKNGLSENTKNQTVSKNNVNLIPKAAAKIPLKNIETQKTTKKVESSAKVKTIKKIEAAEKVQKPAIQSKKLETQKLQAQPAIPNKNIDESNTFKEEAQKDTIEQENKEIVKETQQIVEPETVKEKQSQEIIKNQKKEKRYTKIFSITKYKNKVKNKLAEYGLSFREFLFMIMAAFISFIIMLLALNKSKEIDTRLKSKADFIDRKSKKTSTLVAKKETQNKDQYFIFDNGVHQTGFIAPATQEKKNFELSSYEPELHRTTTLVEPYQSKHVSSEYDIIQNILKEDAFIELSQDEVEQIKESETVTNPLNTAKKEVQEIVKTKQETKETPQEPQILSSVEIAPQRGFMCVSYNNSINLVGYIFDDVFALYNFQQPKLENYNIKFRMSEKTQHGANFIVRVGKTKMLIAVTKSSMNLEVAF